METKQPTQAETLKANLALIDEARVTELLNTLDTVLTEPEKAQLRSYAQGAANFNILASEVALDVADRNYAKAENQEAEHICLRMAVFRCYQGLIIQHESARALAELARG
jgi:hypothetical protein